MWFHKKTLFLFPFMVLPTNVLAQVTAKKTWAWLEPNSNTGYKSADTDHSSAHCKLININVNYKCIWRPHSVHLHYSAGATHMQNVMDSFHFQTRRQWTLFWICDHKKKSSLGNTTKQKHWSVNDEVKLPCGISLVRRARETTRDILIKFDMIFCPFESHQKLSCFHILRNRSFKNDKTNTANTFVIDCYW